jgi:hypothetical protein
LARHPLLADLSLIVDGSTAAAPRKVEHEVETREEIYPVAIFRPDR